MSRDKARAVLAVTQADRDAGNALMTELNGSTTLCFNDAHPSIQAMARHRRAALRDRDATTAKTPQAAEGEASQPGPEEERR